MFRESCFLNDGFVLSTLHELIWQHGWSWSRGATHRELFKVCIPVFFNLLMQWMCSYYKVFLCLLPMQRQCQYLDVQRICEGLEKLWELTEWLFWYFGDVIMKNRGKSSAIVFYCDLMSYWSSLTIFCYISAATMCWKTKSSWPQVVDFLFVFLI